jgi:rhamnosyltransferase
VVAKVSILIPTKNAGFLFEKVLNSIRNQEYEEAVDLVIVDSGSNDGTLDIARKYEARILEIPTNEFDHGLTRNYGIQNCYGEIVILMSQDAIPQGKCWLENIVDTFTEGKIAGVYVKQIPREDADILTKRNLQSWLTGRDNLSLLQIKHVDKFNVLTPVEKYHLCVFDNVCSAIRRMVWERIPFRQNYFGEDIDWAKHVLEAGWLIAYQPKAAVFHSHNRSLVYEYRRTYMCHRKLYELFQLETIPSLLKLLHSILVGTMINLRYVLIHEPNIKKKLKLSLKVPFLMIASNLGQYCGARDEKKSVTVKIKGV